MLIRLLNLSDYLLGGIQTRAAAPREACCLYGGFRIEFFSWAVLRNCFGMLYLRTNLRSSVERERERERERKRERESIRPAQVAVCLCGVRCWLWVVAPFS